ncbi:hypothetical protein BDF19DRAFT_153950 [Syncephalis fuscata]|nr:hypothetical protein BDF19DRAFT_153950 [Syncephalis fuscata]
MEKKAPRRWMGCEGNYHDLSTCILRACALPILIHTHTYTLPHGLDKHGYIDHIRVYLKSVTLTYKYMHFCFFLSATFYRSCLYCCYFHTHTHSLSLSVVTNTIFFFPVVS